MEQVFNEYGYGEFFDRYRYPIEMSGILENIEEEQLHSFFGTFECDTFENFACLFTVFMSMRERNRHLL
ncbi:hypothetical protein [Metabacillus idriensis]|uniref:hypothetical protein n=1 Tax=Metabacillus idriensis TaxID=324768 RepID=UPI00174E7927|nr:hypothetical protein [Metabacillus idriensis]